MRLVIEEAESHHNYNIIQQVINQPIIHILNNFLSVSSVNRMSHASPDQNMLKGLCVNTQWEINIDHLLF